MSVNICNRFALRAKRPLLTVLTAMLVATSGMQGVETSHAAVPPGQVGAGFVVTAADLAYILKQIKIAEFHVANTTAATGLCGALLGSGPDQLATPLLSFGLRTVDGSCNNLQAGQEHHGAADQPFPRLTVPDFSRPVDTGSTHTYTATAANSVVTDSEPRVISNLIVDQTASNPAAVEIALHPIRTQGNPGVVLCENIPTDPPDCVHANETLFIPNVTTDVGLSPPFNSLFTIFGQFFDHGLDKITNGGNGSVVIPLKNDDPLVAGPDHIFGNADDIPPSLRFMAITRGQIVPGPDGFRSAPNTDSPFVDQSQTYTSHASHQIFLREYTLSPCTVAGDPAQCPLSTGKFLSESGHGGLASWATVKQQSAEKLGLQLVDVDVNNIPLLATDLYGNFIPGPARGLPQYVTDTGLVEGNLAAPVPAPANARRIDTAFLNDISHSASPGNVGAPKTPDPDAVAGKSLDRVAAGQYDDELLNQHYICGDGRCNENIALTAVHQVFHLEHDRLAEEFDTTTLPANVSLQNDYKNTNCPVGCATNDPGRPITFTYGQRLFQAARFVTEMQYQHLVFEEFARKVQPAINPFQPFAFNQTDVDPAITAEFAHAVYRFGHSMLNDVIPRVHTVTDGSHFDISLFDGFLNPAEFRNSGSSASDATANIIMGLSDQVGQEIDEFVGEAVRNKLLGLPQDLPAINMARARSEGIPSLNNVRRQIHAKTNDSQMQPYTNWVDFGANLKHAVSLVNFVAAYGRHPTILAATTVAGKRAAARAIVNPDIFATPPDVAPADAEDFMFATGTWAGQNTGVDDIDLWVGGLAEQTNLFGGLLGPTFNYVFENQLTDLQNGDRFYYLARTPGMNLRTQLEGNSFAELVMRNTPAHTLKADPFATADCKFELAHLTFVGSSVNDDPTTDCNENLLLIRFPDGSVRYRTSNTVDTPGINGQGVYNGSGTFDGIWGGVDNDTFWGGEGNDRIEGLGGDDVVLGGLGDDIITDSSGFDILKGGPGNDAIDGGPNDDIIMAGEGKDFTNGGANTNETFAGPGDDFAIAGQGEDTIFGDGGDDWEEGGDMPDLLIGDSSSLFFDDHNLPGHDILIGQGGDDDYDMEGGDDIGVGGPGVEKIAGASGYDWEIGQGDPQATDADLALPLLGVPLPINAVRDRYNEVEALSGWKFDDLLKGDSVIPSQVNGGGFIGCDALDAAGVARIGGLNQLVTPAMLTVPSAPIVAASVTNYCLLQGNVWGEGNILLGGDGSDTIEGRGANDIIDGDRYLNVRLSVRSNAADPATEVATTDLMVNVAQPPRTGVPAGSFYSGAPATTTLQAAVFAGRVNPGNIVAVREILLPDPLPAVDCGLVATPKNCDTAVFSGPSSEYTITPNVDGSITVADNADPAAAAPITPAVPRATDGVDTLRNIEQLSFCATPGTLRGTCDVRAPLFSVLPSAAVAPASLTFAGQNVGTTSTAQTITLTSSGIRTLNLSNIALTGANAGSFSIDPSGTCTNTSALASGVTCTIKVLFSPQATSTSPLTANVVISHNSLVGSTTVALTGTVTAPNAALAPGSLAFTQTVGTTSAAQIATLSNTGSGPFNITAIAVNGARFARTGAGCPTTFPATLNAGASCQISITFAPTAVGAVPAGSLVVTGNSGGTTPVTTLTTTLAGTGTGPTATITPAAPTPLAFGNQGINVASAAQSATLTVTGAPLTVTAIAVPAPYARSGGTCPTSFPATVAVGSCTIGVTFTPNAAGAFNRTLTVTDDSGGIAGATQTVALAGTGVAAGASLAPNPVAFGNQAIGVASAAQSVTLTVTNGALIVSNITAPAPFARSGGTCPTTFPATVAVGSCTIGVIITPTAIGAANGTLTVTDNAGGVAGTTQTTALTATGFIPPPAVPTTVADNFNRVNANNLGAAWQQTLTLGIANLRLSTNQALGALTGHAYLVATGGATQGAGFTLANTTVNNTALYLKASGALGATSGQLQNAIRVLYNAGNVTIATTTNGNGLFPTYTPVGTAITTSGALVSGNKLLAAVDANGRAWVWKVVGTTTTLLTPNGVLLPANALWTTGGGRAGMSLPGLARVDDFVR